MLVRLLCLLCDHGRKWFLARPIVGLESPVGPEDHQRPGWLVQPRMDLLWPQASGVHLSNRFPCRCCYRAGHQLDHVQDQNLVHFPARHQELGRQLWIILRGRCRLFLGIRSRSGGDQLPPVEVQLVVCRPALCHCTVQLRRDQKIFDPDAATRKLGRTRNIVLKIDFLQ